MSENQFKYMDLRHAIKSVPVLEHPILAGTLRPSHTLRCYTPAMGRSKAPAMYQNRMRSAAMHFPSCW